MDEHKIKLEFAPGCFDDFDGTQEELQELIAHLQKMADDGSIFEQSRLLSDDEAEKVLREVASRQPRQ